MKQKHRFLLAVIAVFVIAAAAGTWAIFVRPVRVEVARVEYNVPVQVFGLGTVEARVSTFISYSYLLVMQHCQSFMRAGGNQDA